MSEDKKLFDMHDNNPDPINGQPGAHPVGTGVGAASAGTIGAAFGGAVGGPVGAVVGAAVGAVAGGLLGKNAAEVLNPTVEEDYWRTHYTSRPYVAAGQRYEDYQPAYRTGYEGYHRYAGTGKRYEEVEPELRRDYETRHKGTGLAWERAKHATRDAWHRVENARPGQTHPVDAAHHVPGSDKTAKLHEERLIADKQRNKAREVSVNKRVETRPVEVSVPVERERVVIERVPTPTVEDVPPRRIAHNQANINEPHRVERLDRPENQIRVDRDRDEPRNSL